MHFRKSRKLARCDSLASHPTKGTLLKPLMDTFSTMDMLFPASGGKQTPRYLSDMEKLWGNNVTLYGHAIARGGNTKFTITPAATPVIWIPKFSSEKTGESFSVDSFAVFVAIVGVRC